MPKYRKHKMIYRPGDFKVRSDESGLTVMNSETKVTWEGYKRHKDEFDEKHPQLIIYPHDDRIDVHNSRPTSEDDADLQDEGRRSLCLHRRETLQHQRPWIQAQLGQAWDPR